LRILIAEDDLTSRMVLSAVLGKSGHDVVESSNGGEAWAVLRKPDSPALAILDWMMPVMDGPEVVRRVRALDSARPPYLIILTTRSDKADIIEGLEAGANDYVSKPFDPGELRARVEVGCSMIRMQEALAASNDKLARYAAEMETLAAERARQLVHADRMATLGTLSSGVAHEINNPATFISGNAQTLERALTILAERIRSLGVDPDADPQLSYIIGEIPGMLSGIRMGVDRITTIVSGLKNYSRQDPGVSEPFELSGMLEEALQICRHSLKYNVTVVKRIPDGLPDALGDRRRIEQVLVNLFTNAADAMSGMKEGVLTIAFSEEQGRITVTVRDNGPGLKPNLLDRIFDPFFTTKEAGKGTGLGLSISKGIIEDHGGGLTVRNAAEGGAEFAFSIPVARPAAGAPEEETADEGAIADR